MTATPLRNSEGLRYADKKLGLHNEQLMDACQSFPMQDEPEGGGLFPTQDEPEEVRHAEDG